MIQANMSEVSALLQGLADVYGKPHTTKAALVHWWETLKEFDYNDVIGCLGYWAKESNKMPSPRDVWEKLNSKRTGAIEVRAEQERRVNRGDALPDGFAPTAYGRAMLKKLLEMKPTGNKREQKWPISMRRHLSEPTSTCVPFTP